MSLPATTPALPLNPFPLLDGESSYHRWKESVLLRLHTAGLARHVLSSSEQSSAGEKKAAEKWANDDAVCRGYVLSTLSDRLLPVYAHHATAGAVWLAVARTYDLDMEDEVLYSNKVRDFQYDEGKPLLEQLAHLEALATVTHRDNLDSIMPYFIGRCGFPLEVKREVNRRGSTVPMDEIWKIARRQEVLDRLLEDPPPAETGEIMAGEVIQSMNCARSAWRSVFDRSSVACIYGLQVESPAG